MLDVGAHIGYTVMLAAIAAGCRGRVIAWEPHPGLFRALEHNVAAMSAEHRAAAVDLRNTALGSKAGKATLVRPPPESANDSTSRVVAEGSEPDGELRVSVETIDDVLGLLAAQPTTARIGVMKIDAEGGELDVLAGARGALEERRIRHIVFEDHSGPSSDVMRVLRNAGYEIFALGWTLRGLRIAPAVHGPLAAPYEAPSYIATLSAGEIHARCDPAGWTTLRGSFAGLGRNASRRTRTHDWTPPGQSVASGGTRGTSHAGGAGERRYQVPANIHLALLSKAREIGLSGDVLDFGAGTGELTARLAASGLMLRLTAIDLLPPPAVNGQAVTWLQADLNGPVPLPAESFDAIVSAEVIEHLENPRAVFREFNRLLRPGGYLLLTTPNQESLRSLASLALRGHFVDFLDSSYPAHITALVRRDFERIAAETGFEAPTFSYTATGAVPGLPRFTWQDLSFGRLRGRRFSDNLVVVARKATA